MIKTIVENQLGAIKGGKVRRYTRKYLRLGLEREKRKREDADRAQKRFAQWLQRNPPGHLQDE